MHYLFIFSSFFQMFLDVYWLCRLHTHFNCVENYRDFTTEIKNWGQKKVSMFPAQQPGEICFLMNQPYYVKAIFFTFKEHTSLFFLARLILKKKLFHGFIYLIIFIKIHYCWFRRCFFYLKYVYFIKIAKWILQCLLSCLFHLFIHFYKVYYSCDVISFNVMLLIKRYCFNMLSPLIWNGYMNFNSKQRKKAHVQLFKTI